MSVMEMLNDNERKPTNELKDASCLFFYCD